VALLMNGIPRLKHVVYDVMSDVLTYIDFNTSDSILPIFGLKTVLFHSMELLSSNHLELVTKLCPKESKTYFRQMTSLAHYFRTFSLRNLIFMAKCLVYTGGMAELRLGSLLQPRGMAVCVFKEIVP
jgi:hypothetical protein